MLWAPPLCLWSSWLGFAPSFCCQQTSGPMVKKCASGLSMLLYLILYFRSERTMRSDELITVNNFTIIKMEYINTKDEAEQVFNSILLTGWYQTTPRFQQLDFAPYSYSSQGGFRGDLCKILNDFPWYVLDCLEMPFGSWFNISTQQYPIHPIPSEHL